MTTELPHYILDASIGAKWFLRLDEPHVEQTQQVLEDYHQGRIGLLAPDYIRAEVAHALMRAVRLQRISLEEGQDALTTFYRWQVPLMAHPAVLLGGWRLALRFGCSVYDAGYLALAIMTDARFIHADQKLHKKIAGIFPNELWIEDYRSPS